MNAVTHAFHSQRAFVSIGKGQWDGEITVAFDRAGRYSVGELERQSRDLDVANANIAPSGVRILQPTKLEQLRLRLRSKRPGIVARIKEDFRENGGQEIESVTETDLVFSTRARRIDNGQTLALPVQSAELEPYLRADRRIRSAAPEIVSLAKKIADDDHDGRSVARKLGEWTFKNLKWKRVESDAVETLAKREADCLEHSELYVSLARALGLPARVVFGLAYGSGSFGGHAWVEIYLGDWVEIDPSWGSMDSVDASHLRFKLDSVTSLMLPGQIEMEVLDARGLTVEEQRDPIRLIHALADSTEQAPAAFAYDVQLAANASLGDGAFGTLDDKQRTAVVRAFDRAVVKDLFHWQTHWGGPARVLTKTAEGNRASLVVLRNASLLRIALAKRDDGWFVTEVEDMDSGISLFSGAFNTALHRGIPLERLASANPIESLKEIDQAIAAHGESPELLLLQSQQAAQADLSAGGKEEKPASVPALPNSDDILRKIVAKWPGFAPAYRELARDLASDESSAEEAIALFEKYTTLVPFDPRPWEELGAAYEEKKRFDDAEKALRQFVQLDPENPASSIKLASFLAARGKDQDASKSVAAAFERGGQVNEALDSLEEEVYYHDRLEEEEARFIQVLLTFAEQLEKSARGLRLLAHCQNESGLHAEASETIKRVPAHEKTSWDYSSMASYLRAAHQYQEALDAGDESVKIEADSAQAHFKRACALAQLGRTQDALAAIKKAIELEEDEELDLEDSDLKPLAAMPEFKALAEKRGKGSTAATP